MIQTKPATIDDIYMLDEYISTPGVRDGMLELAASGDPSFMIEETDDGPAVYYKTDFGAVVPVGRPIQLAAGPTQTRTDAPTGIGLGKAKQPTQDEVMQMLRSMPLETQSQAIMSRIAEDQKRGVTGQVIPQDPTLRQKLSGGFQELLKAQLGMDNARARKLSESIFGGESSGAPLGIGLIDITPFVIPLAAQESGISAGDAFKSAEAGNYGTAAMQYGMGVLQGAEAIPGVKLAAEGAKAAGKALAPTAANMAEQYLTKTGAILKMAPDSPGIEVKSAPKLNTPAFKNWFGDSKVVDDKGQPLVMYHGTKHQFEQFDPNVGYQGAMFFSPKREFAEKYMGGMDVKEPIAVYISAKNPFDFDNSKHREMVIKLAIDKTPLYKSAPDQEGMFRKLDEALKDKNANWATIEDKPFQEAIKQLGFDSFYVREGGVKNIAVYDPTQIKSVFNKGTFDPKDPRILYGGGATGVAAQDKEKK